MCPTFHLKVLGPVSHIQGLGSQVEGPLSWILRKDPGSRPHLWVLGPGSQVKGPRWRVPGPGLHLWVPSSRSCVPSPGPHFSGMSKSI